MRGVNFLEKLLDGVTVEWRTLGEVTSIKTGQAVNKQMISASPGEYPVINSGREPLGFIDEWNTDNDPIGITSRGAGVGSLTWQPGKYFRGNLNYSVTIKNPKRVTTRFLYHLLLEMQPEIQALCTYDGIPALNAGNLKELLIPIPCPDNPKKSLEIQAEIVRILDKFDALTNSLSEGLPREIELRQKQYEYYRDLLLSFPKPEEGAGDMRGVNFLEKLLDGVAVEWKALGDVTNVLRGKRLTKSQLTEGAKFPVYHGGLEPLGHYVDSNRPANTVMIINVGASAGTVGYSFVDFWSSDGCFCLEHNELLNNRFLYFALIGHQSLLRSRVRVAGIPTLDAIVVEKLEIPIPCPDNPKKSLEIQAEIVRILDKFDALTNSLSEGLPRELDLRQKQYEYYRGLLLSFPKPEEVGNR